MSELTIVTAFFDIGRKNFEILSRDNETYIEHFECWARINNKVVIYTQPQFKDLILDVRRKYDQQDNTTIILIDDIDLIDKVILSEYEDVVKKGYLENFKVLRNTIAANKPRYDYMMILKYWFMMDAEKRGEIEDFAVWLDFGYGHGNFFANPKEFDFKWQYDFDRKITLFSCHDLDDVPMYEVVRCSLNYIMGFMVVSPKELCESLWNYVREAAGMLTRIGFVDDDQTVLLLAYRNHMKDFKVIRSDWFMPLITHGGAHLTLARDKDNKNDTNAEKKWKSVVHKLLWKSKENRTGIYKVVDRYRQMKVKNKKNSLEAACEKYARDCAQRTYDQVYELFWNDRRK